MIIGIALLDAIRRVSTTSCFGSGQAFVAVGAMTCDGTVARLLALRGSDGQCTGGACFRRRIVEEERTGIEPDFSDGQP
ncbi:MULTISPECIES: hypothetical protein [Nocardioides]|uniref:Uncharacterized protein n=1 Tax=Nocardioides vastitatis TaxID=2568655 RepID=A0ABW0ZL84_9ACTN|nr:hypothetical protein [Nocardioides sp.]THJ10718.1 hypothetical protein E7Z54_02560 [Nocardioides sp.]